MDETTRQDPLTEHPRTRIVIIGAGFAGLGMGIQLKRRGEDDFLILDRGADVGGTWRDNTYPGAACDVPSHLYSFSFRPNPDWSSVYSPGPEIQQYLQTCADEEGLRPHLRLETTMEDASWSAEEGWRVTTDRGVFTSDHLIVCTGHLADEHLPGVPGLETFTGEAFHSARWDERADLTGKRVGVVGTGASAIQLIPEVVKVASEVVVFQRTPAYVIPRRERPYTEGEKRMFRRDPDAIRALRAELFWSGENTFAQRRGIPQFLEQGRRLALSHLAAQVPDPELRERLTPHYDPGCKRVLISNTYYPALVDPKTTLESSALARVEAGSAVAASGASYDLDVLVFATGFEAAVPPFARHIHGRDGVALSEQWDEGMQAFHSTTVHNFPNMFSINGPNTSLGHNSIVYIIESQIEYILGALDHLRANDLQVLEPTAEAEEEYVERIDRGAAGTVWTSGGCESWYLDPRTGRLTLIWPDSGAAFRQENSVFSPEGYRFTPAEPEAASAAV